MRLVHKLLLVLVVSFFVPLTAVGGFAWWSMRRIAHDASAQSADNVREAEAARLQQLTVDGALRVSSTLALVEREVRELAAHFDDARRAAPPPDPRLYPGRPDAGLGGWGYVDAAWGAYADFDRRGAACPWLPRPAVQRAARDPAFRASVARLLGPVATLSGPFARARERNADLVDLVWVVLASGLTNVWPAYDYRRVLAENPEVVDLDESREDYVRLADPTANPDRRVLWLAPYHDSFKDVWMTSCVAPLYDGDTFLGTLGMDILLSTITQQVLDTRPSHSGYALLLTGDGRPIALPSQGVTELFSRPDKRAALQGVFGAGPRTEASEVALESVRLGGDPALDDLAAALRGGRPGKSELTLAGSARLAAWAPVATTGWSFAAVAPMSDVLEPATRVEATIAAGTRGVVAQFVAFGVLAVAASAVLALVLQSQAVRPLEELTRAIGSVRWDRLDLAATMTARDDEIGRLQARYAQMLALLRAARDENEARAHALARSNAELGREVEVRRQAEAQLSAEKELLRVTLFSIGDGVITTDREGAVVLLNPVAAALTGWAPGEARGRPVAEVFRVVGPRRLDQVLSAGHTGETDERATLHGRDDRARRIAYSAAPIGERRDGVVIVFRDVTARLRVEEEMARIEKLESVAVLAAGIAHDFNNLLSAIGGNLSMLELEHADGTRGRQRVDQATKAFQRAAELTLQLLTFARGGAPMRRVVSVAALFRETAEFAVRGSNVAVAYDVEEGLWAASADPGQLSRVLHNLVINAVQAMPSGGTITLCARNVTLGDGERPPLPPGRYVEAAVRDQGVGIPPERLSRVFDPFYTTKAHGSGLGLAVCFSILKRHDGLIDAESEVGHGTTFRFWLPASPDAVDPASAPVPAPPARHARVLVMDDDDLVRDTLAAMLEALGHEALTARDGGAALAVARAELLAERRVDVAFLDLTVRGGMGGLEALTQLRQLLPGLPAIVASGYSADPVLAEPERYGFAAALPKPFQPAVLAEALARALSGR